MEPISLQPMVDQEIDQVSGGLLPAIIIAAAKFGGAVATSAVAGIISSYLYDAWRHHYRQRNDAILRCSIR